ncbi:helix-turn-helix transcriptional regulator [Enterococcus sp. AZ072]|uniref:helix-turn-helix transcriptional regulator n=1 Tax=unclassified Enterococcus TaxID=2608891 RepID=UPI003D27520B
MIPLTDSVWQKINTFIYSIYQTDTMDALRVTTLEKLPELVISDCSFFDMARIEKGQTRYFNPLSLTISQEKLNEYFESFIYGDYVSWMFSLHKNSVVYCDSKIVTEEVREQTPLYNQWLEPMNLYYSCGINFVRENTPYGSLNLFNSRKRGDFTQQDLAILTILEPHFTLKLTQLYPHGLPILSDKTVEQPLDKFHLTEREQEVVRWLCSEASMEEISQQMYISVHTVRKHAANIYRKTSCKNRNQLIAFMNKALNT